MAEALDAILNPFRSIFEWILSLLEAVNIVPPAFGAQLVLAVLLGFGIWYTWRNRQAAEPNTPARLVATLGGAALSIVLLAILADWGSQILFPMSHNLEGTVLITASDSDRERCLLSTHVELLDFRHARVVASSGQPDSRTGKFDLTFRPEFSNPPRELLVISPCSDSLRVAVTRRQLRSRQPIDITVPPRSS